MPCVSRTWANSSRICACKRDVERGRRLVGDDQRRLEQQRHRDHDPLAHPARELVGVVVEALLGVGDPDLAEQLDDPASHVAERRLERTRGWLPATCISWRPTDIVGLSEPSGSWKIIAISAPRILRISSGVSAVRSRPPNSIEPPVMRPLRARILRIAAATVDLPEPDSPTSPTISPRSDVERHVAQRREVDSADAVGDAEAANAQQRARSRDSLELDRLGSASRSSVRGTTRRRG